MANTENRTGDLALEIQHRLEQQGILSTWTPNTDNTLDVDVAGEAFVVTVQKKVV